MKTSRMRHLAGVVSMLWMAVAWPLAPARDEVRVVGSSTVLPFAAAVAEVLGQQGKFRTPTVEALGTGGGFRLFCAGIGPMTPDIAEASRPMTSAESADCARHGVHDVLALRVGIDGLMLLNARNAPRFSLTREQLFLAVARHVPQKGRLIANPYRRWNEISAELPDAPIRIYGPAPNHGTRDAFSALALLPVCERMPEFGALSPADRSRQCQMLRLDGAWVDVAGDYALLLRRLLADPQALGILGFSYFDSNRHRLKAARIDGVDPAPASFGNWRYPLSRPLFIYVKTAHVGAIPGLREYLQEFFSERAMGPQGYLVEKGLTPLPGPAFNVERAKLLRVLARP